MKRVMKTGLMIVTVGLVATAAARIGFADDTDRTGKLGIGAAVYTSNSFSAPGLGLRYWFSDRMGMDLGGYFLTDDGGTYTDRKINGASGSLVFLLKKKGGLRLEGLLGPSYDFSSTLAATPDGNATQTRLRTVTYGVGLGAEYSFQELPDLGLAAAVTGFGASYSVNDVSQNNDKGAPTADVYHDTYWTYASRPEVSIVARYYF
jgi:hypothetical protein